MLSSSRRLFRFSFPKRRLALSFSSSSLSSFRRSTSHSATSTRYLPRCLPRQARIATSKVCRTRIATTLRRVTTRLRHSSSSNSSINHKHGSMAFDALPLNLHAAAVVALTAYLLLEVAFYAYFHRVLVPRANELTEPAPYLDHLLVAERHLLLVRILTRLEAQAVRDEQPMSQVLTRFFLQWFREEEATECWKSDQALSWKPQLCRLPTSSTTSSTDTSSISSADEEDESPLTVMEASTIESANDDDDVEPATLWRIPGLGRAQITEFLAWALFAREAHDLTADERAEFEYCLEIMRGRTGVVFPDKLTSRLRSRRLSLEEVSPLHRPLAVYLCVEAMRCLGGAVLVLAGFSYVTSPEHPSVPGWYRPGKGTHRSNNDRNDETSRPLLPLVFFHGIAPAGLALYLPMILSLVNDGRPTLLVEQPSISGRLGTFQVPREDEVMEAVEQLVASSIDKDVIGPGPSPLLWAGHSFGSCPLTWMQRREGLRRRTAGLLLLDPVTLLLSDPDVMLNFLYTRELSKIRLAAASEIFTEYYLRRHFAWYNTEACLDDNDKAPYQITVALSGQDEIVNAPAVFKHLQDYPHVRTIYWPQARHAHCVMQPPKWRQLQQAVWQQEENYWQSQAAS